MKKETGWVKRVYIEVRTGQRGGASLEGALDRFFSSYRKWKVSSEAYIKGISGRSCMAMGQIEYIDEELRLRSCRIFFRPIPNLV